MTFEVGREAVRLEADGAAHFATGGFDLDDLGAHVRKEECREGTLLGASEVQDADAGERGGRMAVRLLVLRHRASRGADSLR
ncbi:MAG: hypothetical protein U5Q44_08115 [Dehalococcoidia bacterium]|nr:hypothetical protein [Dehalococcoidia bacterium]